jgi:uncharacterized membrane protein
MNKQLQKIALSALFIAMAVIGANIKIYGSVAFDSMPAFLAAVLLGGPYGAIVGFLGHMVSAALSGFPLTLPMHIVIAFEMAIICFITGFITNNVKLPVPRNETVRETVQLVIAMVIAFLLNGFASPLILIVWPGMGGLATYFVYLPPLVIATAANVVLAGVLAFALKKPFHMMFKDFKKTDRKIVEKS